MTTCPRSDCLNGCGGARADCPMREFAPDAPRQRGRPLTYTRPIADAICARLATGESLRSICRDAGMPPRSTVQGWVIADWDGFGGRYARAWELGLEELADETLEIADDASRDRREVDGRMETDHEHIQRSRLRVDTRKWLLSKRLPKSYGEKVQTELSGSVGMTWGDGTT